MNSQEKHHYWSSLIEQQQQSGISITQFCAEQNISYQTFYVWAKKLRTQPEPQRLQPIIVTDTSVESENVVTLILANGLRAQLPIHLSASQIQHWVAALQ
ncbi:IS66 family insertion sequence element accessory protein TnpA [Shewanella oncorhynchi]|uniref:IS66 family insertion sequence element accessory protein TnpA n=1 Tax=Shewanella oncorhynchi TaxID=2726434 RepID=UPI003D794740